MAVQAWLRAYIQQLSNAVAVWMTPSSLRLSGSAGVAAHVSMRAWLSAYVQQLSEDSRCG